MTSDQIAPPFIGFIETTYDALLIFEAARRGAIPRITRRLNDPEKPMIHSGAVFLFDEHESGIKRWTDSIVWSPSRILGNFLVYREVNNRANNRQKRKGRGKSSNSKSPVQTPNTMLRNMSINSIPGHELFSDPMGSGALQHRSDTAMLGLSRERERQLVGSLTSAYAFKPNGLIKRTISMNTGAFTQHLISYYLLEDVVNGKLRTPSTVPEFTAFEIHPDLLDKRHFRFPPQTEIGPDGIPRYKAEHNGKSPRAANAPLYGHSPRANNAPLYNNDGYNYTPAPLIQSLQPSPPMEQTPHMRRGPMPIPIPAGNAATPYYTPGSAGSNGQAYFTPGSASSNGYWDQMSPQQSHVGVGHAPSSRGTRPPSSSRSQQRYDPYNARSPYAAPQSAGRRVSNGPVENQVLYAGQPQANNQSQDVKPVQAANGQYHYPDYGYYGPSAQASGSGSVMAQSPTTGQFPPTPFSNWQQLPSTGPHEQPRLGAGISPPVHNNMSLHPHVSGPPGSAGSRPSTGQGPDQGAYQHPPPHQWPSASWDTNAPLSHATGPGPYQPPPPVGQGPLPY